MINKSQRNSILANLGAKAELNVCRNVEIAFAGASSNGILRWRVERDTISEQENYARNLIPEIFRNTEYFPPSAAYGGGCWGLHS